MSYTSWNYIPCIFMSLSYSLCWNENLALTSFRQNYIKDFRLFPVRLQFLRSCVSSAIPVNLPVFIIKYSKYLCVLYLYRSSSSLQRGPTFLQFFSFLFPVLVYFLTIVSLLFSIPIRNSSTLSKKGSLMLVFLHMRQRTLLSRLK